MTLEDWKNVAEIIQAVATTVALYGNRETTLRPNLALPTTAVPAAQNVGVFHIDSGVSFATGIAGGGCIVKSGT